MSVVSSPIYSGFPNLAPRPLPQLPEAEPHVDRLDAYEALYATQESSDSAPQSRRNAVAAAQLAPRLNNKENMQHGAKAGLIGGGVLALVLAIPTGGGSLFFVPAGMMAGGATSAYRQHRRLLGGYGAVRKHLFSEVGIVGTRQESEHLVKKLKNHGVLTRGRDRFVNDLRRLNELPASSLGISDQQVDAVHAVLQQIQQEAALHERLIYERAALQIESDRLLAITSRSAQLDCINTRIAYLDHALANFANHCPVEAYEGPGAERAARASGLPWRSEALMLTSEQHHEVVQHLQRASMKS